MFRPEVTNAPFAPDRSRAADWNGDAALKRNDSFWQASATARYDLSDTISLNSITAYDRLKIDSLYDLDGIGTNPATGNDVVNIRQNPTARAHTFYQELRLVGETGPARWTVGANYMHDVIKELTYQALFSASATAGTGVSGGASLNNQNVKSLAVFGSVDFSFSDTLTLTAALRHARETRRFEGCTADFGDGTTAAFFVGVLANLQRAVAGLDPIPAVPGEAGCVTVNEDLLPGLARRKLKEDNVPYNINLNWKPSENVLAYAWVSRGYKSGNFPAQTGPNNSVYVPVTQEKLQAYEIGTKVRLSPAVRFEAAAFWYDYADKQQPRVSPEQRKDQLARRRPAISAGSPPETIHRRGRRGSMAASTLRYDGDPHFGR